MTTPRYYRAVMQVGTTYTELPNVLEATADIGKRNLFDNYQPGNATITYRRIDSSTPIPTIGNKVRLVDYTSGTTAAQIYANTAVFNGIVSDAVINYGINSKEDTITIMLDGVLAVYGRLTLDNYNFPHATLSSYVDNIETACNTLIYLYNAGSNEDIHSVDWSDSVLNLLTKLANTVYGRIVEGDSCIAVQAKGYHFDTLPTWKFSDAGATSSQKYESIQYESLGDNYYTQTQVQYPIDQVAVSGTGNRVLVIDTLARNATNATTLANYYTSVYSTPVMGLGTISALASQQSTFLLAQFASPDLAFQGLQACVGTQMEVDFRGETITVVIEGASFSASPSDSRYTFYVSPGDLNSYLVLNNSVLGRLDYNKLGF